MLSLNLENLENKESKIILNGMPLDAENEIEHSLCPGMVIVGAVVVAVDQSMCSSMLTLPPLLLQQESKHLSVNSVNVS